MIKEGDWVWARDQTSNERQLKQGKRTFIVPWEEIVDLVVDGVRILATPDHPFYTLHREWKRVGQLRVGDLLFANPTPTGR